MSINVIAHNLPGMNAERNLGISTGNKNRSLEKLASGYRINRSGDDAAGLAISEKMRRLVRGLNQGTENAQDGASWVQIGDGSLEEAHSMLHRMTQLSVKSLNGTWTESDRASMQAEFEQLQREIDRLTDATTFNEKHIFAEHDIPYYQFEGNISWMPNQKHSIGGDNNTMNITYRMAEGEAPQTASIQVPMGVYTTKELIDEIDTALEKEGLLDKGIIFEYTRQGTCNLNLEGGTRIDEVTGGLAYLLYDVYEGGSTGALIGTTGFKTDTTQLTISAGNNDTISFDIISLDGTKVHKDLTFPTDPVTGLKRYTRQELIDWLNDNLKDTSVRAEKYGLGIKLASDDSIITCLKGNMFKVDDQEKGETIYHSVFYDNIGYGSVDMLPAVLTGGGVLSTRQNDLEHGHFYINSSNNELRIKPNGSNTVTTINILPPGTGEGYFDAEGMKNRLNELFANNHLDLEASIHGDASQNEYQGLVITSKVKGLGSDVGIDPLSSAYNTLFVTRAYNKVERPESYVRDPDSNKDAYYIAGKVFSQNSWPLEVTAGSNDKFILSVNQKDYEITLDTGVDGVVAYNNGTELLQGIRNGITAVRNTIADPEEAALLASISVTNNYTEPTACVRFISTKVESIDVSAFSDAGQVNKGYADIFTTSATFQTDTKSGQGSVTLNESIKLPATIYAAKQTFSVVVGGERHTITLDKGPYNTYDEILAELNKKLPKAIYRDDPIVFTTASDRGTNKVFNVSGTGTTVEPTKVISLSGRGADGQQGAVGDSSNEKAAEITINMPYFSNLGKIDITAQNNTLVMDVNGKKNTISLDIGASYNSVSKLAEALQSKLNAAFGTGDNGIQVKTNGNKMILTTNLKGNVASISCSSADSNFLKYANTDIRYASMQFTSPLGSSIQVKRGDTFVFDYNGSTKTLTFDKDGSYTRTSIKSELNRLLENANIDVRAVVNSSSTLTLQATIPGKEQSLKYSSLNGGTAMKKLFPGADTVDGAASVLLDKKIQDRIEIKAGNEKFKITVNNVEKEVTLPVGSYTNRTTFVRDLNTALNAVGVKATLEGEQVRLTTQSTGSSASILVKYDENSALKSIFGLNRGVFHSGLVADFNGTKLRLTAVDENKNPYNAVVSVSSSSGSIFQTAIQTSSQTVAGKQIIGYHSKIHSAVNGAPLRDSIVKIDQWNDKLSFNFHYAGEYNYRRVNITLERKEYTYDELKKALEEKLNSGLSANSDRRMEVEVSADGVKIKAKSPGRHYYMDEKSFSGGFYYNVLRRTAEQEQKTKPSVKKGENSNAIYAVGRKDVQNNTTIITKGVNDTLTLDFTYGNTVKTFSMTLNAGNYKGAGLAGHIQDKLNEQLVKEGLEPNLIQVRIGAINTGVYGNDDKNAISFSLANNLKLPLNDPSARYAIDGIGGNAAFSVFYQTDGDIRIAYVTGTKDVSEGVTIPKDSDLSFDVDGTNYKITMPAGRYSQEKMLNELNAQLKAAGVPVIARMEGKSLKLSHTKYGKHQITNISGDAKKWLFFQENSQKEGEKDIWIRVGSESGDGVVIERTAINTSFLGINSVTISKPQYAAKALERVKKAVTKVSSARSYFGSMQNRLEQTIQKNNNTAENTQAAESAIRDADAAKEAMSMSQANVLENVNQSMLAQVNRARQDVLSLLQS